MDDEQDKLFTTDLRKERDDRKRSGGARIRTLILLFAVGVLAAGGYFASQFFKPTPEEAPPAAESSSFLLIDKTRADFKSAHVKTPTQEYTIDYDGTTFMVVGMPQFALDQTKAGNLASSCTYLYASNIAESADNLADYGLDEPSASVTVEYTDGSIKTFLLGAAAPSGARYYLKTADAPNIYTVYSSSGDRFAMPLASLHIIPAWSIAAEDITGISLTRPDGTIVEIQRASVELGISAFQLVQPFVYEADGEDVNNLYAAITGLKVAAFEAEAREETLSLYGLDEPSYTLNVYGSSVEAADDASAAQGSSELLLRIEVGANKNDTQTYVRLEDGAIYLVDRVSLDFLKNATAAELVDRFANIINITKVDKISIQGLGLDEQMEISRVPTLNEDGSEKLDASGQPATTDNFTINGQVADDSNFRKLYQIVIGTRVDGLIPEGKAPAPEARPELSVTYTINVSSEPEVIEYLPYDQDNYAVRRNGNTLFYIMKSRVQMIPDALKAYHDGTFNPADYGV
jgi:hypothetical protein